VPLDARETLVSLRETEEAPTGPGGGAG
jgi:hypothetical protein